MFVKDHPVDFFKKPSPLDLDFDACRRFDRCIFSHAAGCHPGRLEFRGTFLRERNQPFHGEMIHINRLILNLTNRTTLSHEMNFPIFQLAEIQSSVLQNSCINSLEQQKHPMGHGGIHGHCRN